MENTLHEQGVGPTLVASVGASWASLARAIFDEIKGLLARSLAMIPSLPYSGGWDDSAALVRTAAED